MLEAGMKAPEFALPDQNGKVHTLEEYKGKKVILYFYPRDNTPGCTKQACGFGELYPEFSEKGAVVLGVSKDSVASHKKFEEKYGLPFTLLSDTELTCIQAYDVWKLSLIHISEPTRQAEISYAVFCLKKKKKRNKKKNKNKNKKKAL